MKRISLSLKITIITIGLLGAIFFFGALPSVGKWIAELAPEFSWAYYPWLILFWITAIPCYMALALLWRIVKSIDRDELFRTVNGTRLRTVARLAYTDTIIFMVANIAYGFLNINHPSIFLTSAFVCIIGVAFGICMKALAAFFDKAATLQEESDLTI
ncbi:MAG: DUF2975 domain-containing protein [Lachnospiraceae bacterium]|nr:DUF2975 domain-containing protein [Lachnospiraceae bacterium]